MNNTKVIVLLVLIIFVGVGAFYYFYQKQVTRSENISVPSTQPSTTNFPSTSQSPSALPSQKPQANNQVEGTNTNFPSNQPETGAGETNVSGVGVAIQTPSDGAIASSPVTVTGTANVPNGVVVEVKDANGKILGVRKTQACFGYSACQFSATVVFDNSQTASGTITAYSPSLSDNTPQYSQSVSVSFQ